MIDSQIEKFKKYVNKFDFNNEDISRKYYHTFRVVDYAKLIIESITNDERLIKTVMIAALLHDIGRFSQATECNTYNDHKSFDHGNRGAEILLSNNYIDEYESDDYLKDIIIKAVKYHNKKEIPQVDDEFASTVFKVVRDADKTDIMIEQNTKLKNKNYILNENLVNDILNKKLCDTKYCKVYDDDMLVYIGFVFDVNYKKTFEIILNSKCLSNKINILKENINDSKIRIIEEIIFNYINEKLGDDIKC